jgi:signal transduction histidine kinase
MGHQIDDSIAFRRGNALEGSVMSARPSLMGTVVSRAQSLIGKFVHSKFGAKVTNFPPIAWVLSTTTQYLVKQRLRPGIQLQRPTERIAYADLTSTLHGIVTDVVETLGYVGALVATYEPDDSLRQRVIYADPAVVSMEQILAWEAEVARLSPGRPVSLTNPDIARVYVSQPAYQDNLSVKAYTSGKPERSDDLFSLFTPIVAEEARPFVKGIQQALGVQEVITVPFFLETAINGSASRELVGNLFALSRNRISLNDERILAAFGRQAAAAILSERRRLQIQVAQTLTFEIQTSLRDEGQILQRIVAGVVSELGYVGAMVATHESGGALPVRAFDVDQTIISIDQILAWETEIARLSPDRPVSLTNPDIARVYVDQDEYQDNLSVKAYRSGKPERSDDLFSLFTPIVTESARPFVRGIQQALGVQEVIAVPFFLEQSTDGKITRELVGNLFAATRAKRFSSGEIELLQAFGQQAAAGLRNARLYRRAEDRRRASEIFGKMAFSAAASVHTLKNQVGVVRGNLQVLGLIDTFAEEQRRALLAQISQISQPIISNLDGMADILDSLHEPWRQLPDVPTDINECLEYARRKVIPALESWVHISLAPDLPAVKTSPDMMREVFKVLIKNATEAIAAKDEYGEIWLETCLNDDFIAVVIRDTGIGIKPEHLHRIFEMRWTTKRTGLGFGLFWAFDYIEGLGGSITVESTWMQETTFNVQIPISQASALARMAAIG